MNSQMFFLLIILSFLVPSFVAGANTNEHSGVNDNYSYVLSIQDSDGHPICNGSYIGNKQVYLYENCKDDDNGFPFPLDLNNEVDIALSDDVNNYLGYQASEMLIESILQSSKLFASSQPPDPSPFPTLPGYPYQIQAFPDEGGYQTIKIDRIWTNPFSGRAVLATLEDAPEGIKQLELVSSDILDNLENIGGVTIEVVSRDSVGAISTEQRTLLPIEMCNLFPIPSLPNSKHPLNRSICTSQESPFCGSWPSTNREFGAPIVVRLETGKEYLLGQLSSNCQQYASASNDRKWAGLLAKQSLGLEVSTVYDYGEYDMLERPDVSFSIKNLSGDTLGFSDFWLERQDKFEISSVSCISLKPSQSCQIELSANLSDAMNDIDRLNFKINGEDVGIYVAIEGVALRRIKGDSNALWKFKGWRTKGLFNSSYYARSDITEFPHMERTRTIVDPKKMSITYRMAGESLFGPMIIPMKTALYSPPTLLWQQQYMLSGTNNQWVTKSIDIDDPGTYRFMVSRMLLPTNEFGQLDVEVSNICFGNECDFID